MSLTSLLKNVVGKAMGSLEQVELTRSFQPNLFPKCRVVWW
jgi:hypothetical protein